MAPIVETVEIAKRSQEVFAYLVDLSRHGEWQEQSTPAASPAAAGRSRTRSPSTVRRGELRSEASTVQSARRAR
jgi:hypothetical protein